MKLYATITHAGCLFDVWDFALGDTRVVKAAPCTPEKGVEFQEFLLTSGSDAAARARRHGVLDMM